MRRRKACVMQHTCKENFCHSEGEAVHSTLPTGQLLMGQCTTKAIESDPKLGLLGPYSFQKRKGTSSFISRCSVRGTSLLIGFGRPIDFTSRSLRQNRALFDMRKIEKKDTLTHKRIKRSTLSILSDSGTTFAETRLGRLEKDIHDMK